MGEKHEQEADGILSDGVRHYPANVDRLDIFPRDSNELASFSTPVLRHANNAHEYLFLAALDGTGNDALNDPEHETNVAKIAHQVQSADDSSNTRIAAGYIPGAGTQSGFIERALDGMEGYTSEERAETMYKQFIEQAYKWRRIDPQAKISLAEIGFSRGADEVAIFARLVHERGIQDPRGADYTYDSGLVKHVEYTRPALVAPGEVAQAVGLFDPVGTGNELRNDDRRLPPTVISGLQLTAMDERRSLFRSDHIIDPGISADGRFAGLYVPGAHSDVGGSYHRDGLSIRAGNLMIDYLNNLSDEPFLKKSVEPDDPRLNVVHRSEEGMFIYRITGKVNRLEPEGYNELLVPRRDIGKVADPYNAEPADNEVRARFELQPFRSIPAPGARDRGAEVHPLSMQVDHMLSAAQQGDWQTFSRNTQALAAMEPGKELNAQTRDYVDVLEQTALQQSMQPPASPAMEMRGPVR